MIPKVIYMCHKKLDKIKVYSLNWKRLNPEYQIRLYDDEMCKNFLLKEYSQLHLDIFNHIQDGPIKADFWRVCIVNKYGGVYIDADIQPFVPLKRYIENDDYFITCISMYFKKDRLELQLNPHFIMCDKNNSILESCINKYIDFYKTKPYTYWGWSICSVMIIEGIKEKKPQKIVLNGKKHKFILEVNKNQCVYNNLVVFNNRYATYRNHNFLL